MITNPDDFKALHESRIVSKDPEGEKPERKPLSERMREKWHNTLFSEDSKGGKPKKGNPNEETPQVEGNKEEQPK